MKKRSCIVLMSLLLLLPAFSACGGKQIEGIDPNKTQIYVEVYNGGFGSEYLSGAGTEINDIFITCFPETQGFQAPGYLEDISDVWGMQAIGDTDTIENKIKDSATYKRIFKGATDDGIYGLPWSDSMVGFVFDFELFKKCGWLLYAPNDETTKSVLNDAKIPFSETGKYLQDANGNKILSFGKDGKPNTYDDGQPITEEEWDTMIRKIAVRSNTKPFLWTGEFPDYVNDIFDAVFVQYDGVDNAEIFNTFKGTYRHGEKVFDVTEEEGWRVNEMLGRKKALDFVNKYLVDTDYRHPSSEKSVSNTGAQDLFLFGYEQNVGNPEAAMLIDGCWWENEARGTGTFDLPDLVNNDRGYGQREYRYMLLPDFKGQISEQSVLSTRQAGAIMVKKQTNEDKKAKVKEFIRYLVSDESIKNFVTQTNGLLPYKVELTDDEYNKLTPFMKNVWEMYNDDENIVIFRPKVERLKSRLNYASASKPKNDWFSAVGDFLYKIPLTGLQALRDTENPTEVYMAGMLKYNKEKWDTFLNEVGQ